MVFPRLITSLLIAAAMLVAALTPIAGAQKLHSVVFGTTRSTIYLRGYLELSVDEGRDRIGGYEVGPGTVLKVVLGKTSNANIWVGSDGWVNIWADNATVYINGSLAVTWSRVNINGLHVVLDELNSTLTLGVGEGDSGWTSLTVDGEEVINEWNSGDTVMISGLVATEEEDLNIDFEAQSPSLWCEGAAGYVEVNGESIPVLPAKGLAVLLLVAAVAAAAAMLKEGLER